MSLDSKIVRQHFPALNRKEIFFDNPAGTQVASHCLERLNRYFLECNANHGGAFRTSQQSDAMVEETRVVMADLLNAVSPHEIIFGPNMTTLTFSISRALGRTMKAGDTIVLSHMDHDANVSPWLMLAQDLDLKVRWIDFDTNDYTLKLEDLEQALKDKPRLVAVGYASNALGTINPIPQIVKMAHEAGALVYVDSVQYTPHAPIDVQKLGCDFLVCSSYKFFGPHLGILYGRYDLLEKLTAYRVRPAPALPPGKFETGTAAFESIAGLLGALEYLEWVGQQFGEEFHEQYVDDYSGRVLTFKLGMAAIREYEKEIDRTMLPLLQEIPGLKIYGITDLNRLDERVPTFAVTVEGKTPNQIASALDKEGIFVWDGNFYALEVTTRLGLENKGGLLRIGPVHYNTLDEVRQFADVLKRVVK